MPASAVLRVVASFAAPCSSFLQYNLVGKFGIDKNKLRAFLTGVEEAYHKDAPYHNSTHAADVARSVHFFMSAGGLQQCMTDLEILASVVAALIHDMDHPGRTNAYHIAVRDDKAILCECVCPISCTVG